MRWLFLEEKYLVNTPIGQCFSLVSKALNELGFKKVTIKKEVPPRYMLAECDLGWGQGKREIEFVFKERQNVSEISFKWPYTVDIGVTNERARQRLLTSWEGRKQKAQRYIEEFKSRIGAIEIPAKEDQKAQEKEIIREKEIIVKVRCSYCHRLYDETLDKCPHCGAGR